MVHAPPRPTKPSSFKRFTRRWCSWLVARGGFPSFVFRSKPCPALRAGTMPLYAAAPLCRFTLLHSPSLSFTLLHSSLSLLLLLLLSLLKRAGGFHDDFEICLRTSAGVETVGPLHLEPWDLACPHGKTHIGPLDADADADTDTVRLRLRLMKPKYPVQ